MPQKPLLLDEPGDLGEMGLAALGMSLGDTVMLPNPSSLTSG
jgi:hypothetical protein